MFHSQVWESNLWIPKASVASALFFFDYSTIKQEEKALSVEPWHDEDEAEQLGIARKDKLYALS